MNSKIAFLQERKKQRTAGDGQGLSPVSPAELDHPDLPDPASMADVRHIRTLAATRQRTQVQSRGENKKYHRRLALAIFRKYIADAHAQVESLGRQLTESRSRLEERMRQKKQFERFGATATRKKKNTKDTRKPCTRWIQVLFGAVVVVMLIAVSNGTLSVSSVMLDSTAFSGAYAKTITIALGFFLLPGLGLSIPFHLLRSRTRLAYSYLALLVSAGIVFGFFFAVTWAYTYAVETGNQTLIDLTSIGMGSAGDAAEETKPWFFENANWLSLLFQILADMAFAGSCKSYLSWLSWNYHIFRDKALQQDPEWLALDQEVQDVSQEIADLEGKKCSADERLTELETEQEEYTDAVCAFADALFLQEVDKFEREEERIRLKEAELCEKEAAWRKSQQELDDLLTQTPGINRKGDHHA